MIFYGSSQKIYFGYALIIEYLNHFNDLHHYVIWTVKKSTIRNFRYINSIWKEIMKKNHSGCEKNILRAFLSMFDVVFRKPRSDFYAENIVYTRFLFLYFIMLFNERE